jgi:DNA-binding MarR family transcriptional regulator
LDQWLVLGPIWKNEGIAQKDIAEYCGKDKTSITKIINTLEKKNLVVRVPDQLDHRVKRVVLSNKGKELFLNVLPVIEETRDELRSGISDKEIESLITVLTKVYRNLISN